MLHVKLHHPSLERGLRQLPKVGSCRYANIVRLDENEAMHSQMKDKCGKE